MFFVVKCCRETVFETYSQPFFLAMSLTVVKKELCTKAGAGLIGWKTCVNEMFVSCNTGAHAWFVRVLWFYWIDWIYWQLCVIYIARHLSLFQNGKEALGIKLETTDVQKLEDPLSVMLPLLKTEHEVRWMSVCPEFKGIRVCPMDFQSLLLHTDWLYCTSGKPVTKCLWVIVQLKSCM